MPLYDFECTKCGATQEAIFKVDKCPTVIRCPVCGTNNAKKVIALGHGGSFDDHPRWLNEEVRGVLQDTDRVAQKLEKPIETRGEHKEFLKKRGFVEVG